MKKYTFILLLIVFTITIISCSKEDDLFSIEESEDLNSELKVDNILRSGFDPIVDPLPDTSFLNIDKSVKIQTQDPIIDPLPDTTFVTSKLIQQF